MAKKPVKMVEEIQRYGELLEGFEYDVVTRHPLADETELLKKLELTPEQCKWCDLYWAFMNRMFFVSIACDTGSANTPPLVNYHRREDVIYGHQFYVVTKACPLDKRIVKICLDYLATWIEQNQGSLIDEITSTPGEQFEITNTDIVESQ